MPVVLIVLFIIALIIYWLFAAIFFLLSNYAASTIVVVAAAAAIWKWCVTDDNQLETWAPDTRKVRHPLPVGSSDVDVVVRHCEALAKAAAYLTDDGGRPVRFTAHPGQKVEKGQILVEGLRIASPADGVVRKTRLHRETGDVDSDEHLVTIRVLAAKLQPAKGGSHDVAVLVYGTLIHGVLDKFRHARMLFANGLLFGSIGLVLGLVLGLQLHRVFLVVGLIEASACFGLAFLNWKQLNRYRPEELDSLLDQGIQLQPVDHAREFAERVSADTAAVDALNVFGLTPSRWTLEQVTLRKRHIDNLLSHGYGDSLPVKESAVIERALHKLSALKSEAPNLC